MGVWHRFHRIRQSITRRPSMGSWPRGQLFLWLTSIHLRDLCFGDRLTLSTGFWTRHSIFMCLGTGSFGMSRRCCIDFLIHCLRDWRAAGLHGPRGGLTPSGWPLWDNRDFVGKCVLFSFFICRSSRHLAMLSAGVDPLDSSARDRGSAAGLWAGLSTWMTFAGI